jgi:hypothetical protein
MFIGSPRKICQSYQLYSYVKRVRGVLADFENDKLALGISPSLSAREVYSAN